MALIGGCDRCNLTYIWSDNDLKNKGQYCNRCYDKYYSPEAIVKINRDKKLKQITKKWWAFWL